MSFVVTSEVDDRTVQGLNITCGARIDIDQVSSTMSAVSTISPIALQTTSSVQSAASKSHLPRHSKSSPLAYFLLYSSKPWCRPASDFIFILASLLKKSRWINPCTIGVSSISVHLSFGSRRNPV